MDVGTSSDTKGYGRSKWTNGKRVFKAVEGMDGRNARARRYRDLVKLYSKRIGHVDDIQLGLIHRAAGLQVVLDAMDEATVRGEEVKPDLYVKCCGQMIRLLKVLGLTKFDELPEDAHALEAYVKRNYGIESMHAGPEQQQLRVEALIGDDPDDDDDDDAAPELERIVKKVERKKFHIKRKRGGD